MYEDESWWEFIKFGSHECHRWYTQTLQWKKKQKICECFNEVCISL